MFGFGKDDRAKFKELQAKGHDAIRREDNQEARLNLEKALEIADRLHFENRAIAELCDQTGMVCRRLGDLGAAITYLRRATSLYSQLGPEVKVMHALALHDLGRALRAHGDYVEAAKRFQEEGDIWRSIPPSMELMPHVAACANANATLMADAGLTEPARRMFESALNMRRKCLAPGALEIADTLAGLGSLCFELKDYPAARTYLSEALPIFINTVGPGHELTRDIDEKLKILDRDHS